LDLSFSDVIFDSLRLLVGAGLALRTARRRESDQLNERQDCTASEYVVSYGPEKNSTGRIEGTLSALQPIAPVSYKHGSRVNRAGPSPKFDPDVAQRTDLIHAHLSHRKLKIVPIVQRARRGDLDLSVAFSLRPQHADLVHILEKRCGTDE
jgi:hypothetical protein